MTQGQQSAGRTGQNSNLHSTGQSSRDVYDIISTQIGTGIDTSRAVVATLPTRAPWGRQQRGRAWKGERRTHGQAMAGPGAWRAVDTGPTSQQGHWAHQQPPRTRDAALIEKKVARASQLTALASMVLPVPGGPNRRMPRGGLRRPVKRSGRSCGVTTASILHATPSARWRIPPSTTTRRRITVSHPLQTARTGGETERQRRTRFAWHL